jgi:hypothetical protein
MNDECAVIYIQNRIEFVIENEHKQWDKLVKGTAADKSMYMALNGVVGFIQVPLLSYHYFLLVEWLK